MVTGQQYSLNRDGKERIIKHVYIHDEFDRNSFFNDIALILLETPVAQVKIECTLDKSLRSLEGYIYLFIRYRVLQHSCDILEQKYGT